MLSVTNECFFYNEFMLIFILIGRTANLETELSAVKTKQQQIKGNYDLNN